MRSAFIKLHLSILIAGFTGVFGKLITLHQGPLVWYRMFITSALLYAVLKTTGKIPVLPRREMLKIGGVGAILALHWIFFYGSIKYANVSIGVICFSLAGFFTAFFEPLITRRKLSPREIAYSLVTVAGIMLIFHFDIRYRAGIVLGIVSAALAALFTITNKLAGRQHASVTMLYHEMIGGFLFLSLFIPAFVLLSPGVALFPGAMDLLHLFLLSSVCTILLYLLQIQALQRISPFTVNLSYNLEPIYSIIIAMLFLGEANEVNASFFLGLGLICLSVALQSYHAFSHRHAAP